MIIDMHAEHWVDSMIYYPRTYDPAVTYSENGNINEYEVWVSTDRNAWARVADGELSYATPGEPQTVVFLVPNLVRYVKLIAISGVNGTPIANAAEIEITESLADVVIEGGGI